MASLTSSSLRTHFSAKSDLIITINELCMFASLHSNFLVTIHGIVSPAQEQLHYCMCVAILMIKVHYMYSVEVLKLAIHN